jgi:uroporphyrinogen decarboxylase
MNGSASRTVGQRFEDIVGGRSLDDVLVAIWNTAPFLNARTGVPLRDYYFDSETKLRVQCGFQEAFPDFFCFPGIWADYGALVEPSAFGCPIQWPDQHGVPMAQPVLRSNADISSLRPIDPQTAGMMPEALEEYRYFHSHMDPGYADRYGYLDGIAMSFGPVELAAVLMGHESFFLNLISERESVHELLKKTTESVLRWLRAQEEVNGTLKRIGIADHIPGQVGADHFEEFWLPYTRQIADAFPAAVILYHNEFPVPYLNALGRFRFQVFHFGGELAAVKQSLGNDITLMGNLHPVHLMLNSPRKEVFEEALAVLREGAPGGRFLLSTAGGIAPDTPQENLDAMREALAVFAEEGA